ncbi:MAG: DSD1 family PLP-dependent enzyme [Lentisphaeria bacterium]
MNKNDLDTPCLFLELELFERNLQLLRDRAATAGKALRPHAKTHKCSQIAKRQLACGNCVGICAAKVSEALVLAQAGLQSILITSPVTSPAKISLLRQCSAFTRECIVVVDNYANALELNEAAGEFHFSQPVLLDLDPEMGRTGVSFADAPALARKISTLPNLSLRGIQCYAGQLQHLPNAEQRGQESQRLMQKAAKVFRLLRAEGLPLEIFTGTGTGTIRFDFCIPELTDIQAGSYCVMDAEYAAVENPEHLLFEQFCPALSLATTVISNNHSDHVTVDAGLKALYYTPAAPPRVIRQGLPLPGWRYEWFGDEHGALFFPGEKPALGERIELCLPHCDPTINLHDCIYVTDQGRLLDRWDIDLRGKMF